MKSIERTFNSIQQSNPHMGSFPVFAQTIAETQPNYRILKNWFIKLVKKDEYLQSEKRQLLDYLKTLITPCGMYKTPVDSLNEHRENNEMYGLSL